MKRNNSLIIIGNLSTLCVGFLSNSMCFYFSGIDCYGTPVQSIDFSTCRERIITSCICRNKFTCLYAEGTVFFRKDFQGFCRSRISLRFSLDTGRNCLNISRSIICHICPNANGIGTTAVCLGYNTSILYRKTGYTGIISIYFNSNSGNTIMDCYVMNAFADINTVAGSAFGGNMHGIDFARRRRFNAFDFAGYGYISIFCYHINNQSSIILRICDNNRTIDRTDRSMIDNKNSFINICQSGG